MATLHARRLAQSCCVLKGMFLCASSSTSSAERCFQSEFGCFTWLQMKVLCLGFWMQVMQWQLFCLAGLGTLSNVRWVIALNAPECGKHSERG